MVTLGTLTLLFPLKVMTTYKNIWLSIVFFMLRVIVGLRYQLLGTENLPKGPYLIACKHQSTLETFILPYEFSHLFIFLKKELVDMPVAGWYFKKYGMVAVDRSKPKKALAHMIKAAQEADLSKSPLLLFPEGTRTTPGLPSRYQIGIAVLYEALHIPVVPVALNTGVFWPKKGWKRFPGLATLKFLPPIPPGLSKTELMKHLETTIEKESIQLYKDA